MTAKVQPSIFAHVIIKEKTNSMNPKYQYRFQLTTRRASLAGLTSDWIDVNIEGGMGSEGGGLFP